MATVTTEQELQDAISAFDPQIIIQNDIVLTVRNTVNYNLEITSDGSVLSWGGAENQIMFSVIDGGSLTIGNVILDGRGKYAILVNVAASTFVMNEGAVLRNVSTNSANRAVRVGLATDVNLGGTFVMNGGLITGVMMDAAVSCTGGTMVMSGEAAIADNQAYGIALQGSTLTMTGNSRISGNVAARPGAGILAFDQAVINMGRSEGDAPRISDNRSTDSYSGGIYLAGGSVLNMDYDSAITGNRAATLAGGVGMSAGTLNMSGNAVISGNLTQAGAGGGIFGAAGARIIMSGHAAVRDNEVADAGGLGGGVYLQQDGTVLTLNESASIDRNRAGLGGGIYLRAGSRLISGTQESDTPVIADNAASAYGGGIYIDTGGAAVLTGLTGLNGNTAQTAGMGIYNIGAVSLAGSVKILDGFYYNSRMFVPVILAPLTDAAAIRLEGSDYMEPENIPVVAAVKGGEYNALSAADSAAFILPDTFSANTPVYRNRERDEVVIGLVLRVNRASLSLLRMPTLC